MLVKIICVGLLVQVSAAVAGFGEHEAEPGYDDQSGDDDDGCYHQDDSEDSDAVRVKRFEARPAAKTLSPQEIQEVRDAIKQILSGHRLENPFTPLPSTQAPYEKRSIPDKREIHTPRPVQLSYNEYQSEDRLNINDEYTDETDNMAAKGETFGSNDLFTEELTLKPSTLMTDITEINDIVGATIDDLSTSSSSDVSIVKRHDLIDISTADLTSTTTIAVNYDTEINDDVIRPTINPLLPLTPNTRADDVTLPLTSTIVQEEDNLDTDMHKDVIGATTIAIPTRSPFRNTMNENPTTPNVIDNEQIAPDISPYPIIPTEDNEEGEVNAKPEEIDEIIDDTKKGAATTRTPSKKEPEKDKDTGNSEPAIVFDNGPENAAEAATAASKDFQSEMDDEHTLPHRTQTPTYTSAANVSRTKTPEPQTTAVRTTTSRTKRTTKFQLDVPALLEIIANLTYDYEMNLTDNLNATLLKYSIPTCGTPTTTEQKGIFVDYDANATGTIVAKCFVCGLEAEGIPRSAHCADAFAGDFLPLVPVDMTARGKISKFRKYCRFADVPHYMVNASQPRSMYGRWTGGCAVRWIDLSGVYTQRTCRNRRRAVMGRHYGSKRMAKLEMALSHIDNGCITSPMATLVPLSRGISLYARFHACVCTGSWCNAADLRIPWTGGALVPLSLLVGYIAPRLLV